MADEVQLHVVLPGAPATLMPAWREQPPEFLRDFSIVDEAYDTLVFEQTYYDWPAKLVMATGVGLLFKGNMQSIFRLTARFDPEGSAGTRLTVIGTAHPTTREQLGRFAAEHGGPVGVRQGV
jgi:hypothetical protein